MSDKKEPFSVRFPKAMGVATAHMADAAFVYAPALFFLAQRWLIGIALLIALIFACCKLPRYRTYWTEVRGFAVWLISVNLIAILSLAFGSGHSWGRLLCAVAIGGIGLVVGTVALQGILRIRAGEAFGKWPPD